MPYDAGTGRVPHAEGRVIRDGGFSPDEYVTGWIKRGPTGVIGTNKSDAVETVASLLADVRRRAGWPPAGGPASSTGCWPAAACTPLDLPAWHRIDAAEVALGTSHGRLRTTLAHRAELLAAAQARPRTAERSAQPRRCRARRRRIRSAASVTVVSVAAGPGSARRTARRPAPARASAAGWRRRRGRR